MIMQTTVSHHDITHTIHQLTKECQSTITHGALSTRYSSVLTARQTLTEGATYLLTYLLKGCEWSVASTAFNTIHSANTCFSSVSNNRELINNGNISPTKYQMLQKTRCAAPMANTISSTRCKFKTVQVSQLDCSHAGMKPLIQSHIRLYNRVSSQYAVLQAQHYHKCDIAMTTLPAAHWLQSILCLLPSDTDLWITKGTHGLLCIMWLARGQPCMSTVRPSCTP